MLAGGLDAREGALVLYFELALARHGGDVVGDAPRWRRYKLRGQEKSAGGLTKRSFNVTPPSHTT